MEPSSDWIKLFIEQALAEDKGDGDHTSLACIPAEARGSAILWAKESGILAGVRLAESIFHHVDAQLDVQVFIQDGKPLEFKNKVLRVSGRVQSILLAERLVLNCIQRMSGIATVANKLSSMVKPYGVTLLDTRKTTPNIRPLEKWAVQLGGAGNHRFGLFDRILIKDNHVDYAGGVALALGRVKDYLRSTKNRLPVEIEVRNFEELEEVLIHRNLCHRVMLDNFSPENLKKAVQMVGDFLETEASGGITESNLLEYAQTGVQFISMGALTHSVKSLDLSLKAE